MTFLRSPVLAIFAMVSLLEKLKIWRTPGCAVRFGRTSLSAGFFGIAEQEGSEADAGDCSSPRIHHSSALSKASASTPAAVSSKHPEPMLAGSAPAWDSVAPAPRFALAEPASGSASDLPASSPCPFPGRSLSCPAPHLASEAWALPHHFGRHPP